MKRHDYSESTHLQIVERLILLRHERGLTQEDVRFSNDDINIGRIESGKHRVSLKTIILLCNFYKVTLPEFFDGISIRDDASL